MTETVGQERIGVEIVYRKVRRLTKKFLFQKIKFLQRMDDASMYVARVK